MQEILDKFLYPIVVGTLIGFILTWLLETIRLIYKRRKILRGLYRQIDTISRFSLHNKTFTEQLETEHVVPIPYPTNPFEAAIFSENGISVKENTLQATIDYLIKAYELNAMITVLQNTFNVANGNKTNDSRSETKIKLFEQVTDFTNDYSMYKCVEKLKIQINSEHNRWFIIY